MFGKQRPVQIPARPASRTIDALNPDYFRDLADVAVAGGADLPAHVVPQAVANAIHNTGSQFFARLGDSRSSREFDGLFALTQDSPDAADHLIDYLVGAASSTQDLIRTLLTRLLQAYSHP